MKSRAVFKSWREREPEEKGGLLLGVAAGIIAIFLLFAPKPWDIAPPEANNIPFEYFAAVYGWWGGLFAMVGVAALYLTRGWWLRGYNPKAIPTDRTPRWFWPLVTAAMLLTAGMGVVRLGHDLWDDERKTLQQFVQGDYRPRDDGGVRFREFGWGRTLFNYREPNNHILHSIFARLSIDTWKMFRAKDGSPFSEFALRLPAFLFGILSVAALALLLKELGLARAGAAAAFLLAIHPWHIRYACEARAYALVLCLVPLLLIVWLRAMRGGAWRWWSRVAACEFALLYAYPVTIYPVGTLNIVTALLLAFGQSDADLRAANFRRWLASSFIMGLLLAWLFLPCVPQMANYLAGDRAQGGMGIWWLRDFFSHLFAGAAWFRTANPNAVHPELFAMFAQWPHIGPALAWIAVLLGLAGALRIALRGWAGASCAIVLLLPAAAAYVLATRGGQFLHDWYLIYLLPGTVASVATGFDTLFLPWRERIWTNRALLVLVAGFAAAYWVVTAKAREWLLTKPLQPMRESVLLTRPTTLPNYPGYADVITTSFNTPPGLYDPHCKRIGGREELVELMRESDSRDIPLFLNIGNPWAAAHHHPELYRMVTESACFEEIATLAGFDPTLDRKVMRYVPGSQAESGSPD
jgi:hypothetical protein